MQRGNRRSAGKKNFFNLWWKFTTMRQRSASSLVVTRPQAVILLVWMRRWITRYSSSLPSMRRGGSSADIANVETRKRIEQDVLTSHGEAGQYFVTFFENHDQGQRSWFMGPTQLIHQLILGYGILFGLPEFHASITAANKD